MATRHSRSARDQAALCELWGMLNASVSVGKLSGAADVLELEGNSGLPGDHSSAVRGWSSKKSARVVTRSDAFIPGCKTLYSRWPRGLTS